MRTWIRADSDLDPELIEDVAWFARQEGLEAPRQGGGDQAAMIDR